MATGIIAVAAALLGMAAVAWPLFWLNVAAYVVLGLLTLARLAWYPRLLLADLLDHTRGPGFFTVVAATCVLGNDFVIVGGQPGIATFLWGAGIVLWLGLTY